MGIATRPPIQTRYRRLLHGYQNLIQTLVLVLLLLAIGALDLGQSAIPRILHPAAFMLGFLGGVRWHFLRF
jgi:hypothetical protein